MLSKKSVSKKLDFSSGNRRILNPSLGRADVVQSSRRSTRVPMPNQRSRSLVLASLAKKKLLSEEEMDLKTDSARANASRKKQELLKKQTLINFNTILKDKANIYSEDSNDILSPEVLSAEDLTKEQATSPKQKKSSENNQIQKRNGSAKESSNSIVQKEVESSCNDQNGEGHVQVSSVKSPAKAQVLVPEVTAPLEVGGESQTTFSNKFAQTDPQIFICGCPKCKGLVSGILQLFNQHGGLCKAGAKVFFPESGGNQSFNSHTLNLSTEKVDEDSDAKIIMVPLVVGSSVKVPLTKKTTLRLAVKNGDPQSFTNELLDIFYKPEELANMSFLGRTKGSNRLDPDVADAMQAYIYHKYDKLNFNFNRELFIEFVNTHCYNHRKKLLKKADENGTVRPPLQKRSRKEGDTETSTSKKQPRPRKPTAKKSKLKTLQKNPTKPPKHSSPSPSKSARNTKGGKRPKFILVDSTTFKPVTPAAEDVDTDLDMYSPGSSTAARVKKAQSSPRRTQKSHGPSRISPKKHEKSGHKSPSYRHKSHDGRSPIVLKETLVSSTPSQKVRSKHKNVREDGDKYFQPSPIKKKRVRETEDDASGQSLSSDYLYNYNDASEGSSE